MDLETTFRLKRYIPETIPVVSESGLKSSDDLQKLCDNDVTAALIGETLMKAGLDGDVLKRLRSYH